MAGNNDKINQNVFIEGTNQLQGLQEKGTEWYIGRNAINSSSSGDFPVYQNEPSTLECIKVPYTIIGSIWLNENKYVIFSTDNVNSEIGLADLEQCTYEKIVNSPCLNFNTLYPIKGVSRYNFDCTYVIYWDDGLNPTRTMNINNPPYKKIKKVVNDCVVEEEDKKALDCEKLRLTPLFKMPCVKVKKSKLGGSLPNGQYAFAIAYAINDLVYTDYYHVGYPIQIFSQTNSGGAIEININQIDNETFDRFELVLISVINGITNYYSVGFFGTSVQTITIDSIRNEWRTYTSEQINTRKVYYEKSKSLQQIGDYLVRTQPTGKFMFNYQPLANFIKTKWVCVEYDENYYKNGGTNVGYLRDEVYAFYIRWIYTDGDKSAMFHIPGRPPRAGESDKLNDCNYYNFWKNNYATYDQYNPNGYGETEDGGKIIAEGEMGYWQSLYKYPDNKPEIWNLSSLSYLSILPLGNSNLSDYDLCGKYIRHHRFPDVVIPSKNGGNPITLFHHDCNKKTIRVLGVKFEDIILPRDNNGNIIQNIQGYEIIRADRSGNKTVIAKGIVNYTRTSLEYNSILNSNAARLCDFTYIADPSRKIVHCNWPLNPTNSTHKMIHKNYTSFGKIQGTVFNQNFQSFWGLVNYDGISQEFGADLNYEFFSFHSPDTTFNRPSVSAGELKTHITLYSDSCLGKIKKIITHPSVKVFHNCGYWRLLKQAMLDAFLAMAGQKRVRYNIRQSQDYNTIANANVNFQLGTSSGGGAGFQTFLDPMHTVKANTSVLHHVYSALSGSILNLLGKFPLVSAISGASYYFSKLFTITDSVISASGGNPILTADNEVGQFEAMSSLTGNSSSDNIRQSLQSLIFVTFQKLSVTTEYYKTFAPSFNPAAYQELLANYCEQVPTINRYSLKDAFYITNGLFNYTQNNVNYTFNNLYRTNTLILNLKTLCSSNSLNSLLHDPNYQDDTDSCYLSDKNHLWGKRYSTSLSYIPSSGLGNYYYDKSEYENSLFNLSDKFKSVTVYSSIRVPNFSAYGSIQYIPCYIISDCINFVDPSDRGKLLYKSKVTFGGDTYITPYSERNPFFYFYDWLDRFDMPNPVMEYIMYKNINFPRFFINIRPYSAYSLISNFLLDSGWCFEGYNPDDINADLEFVNQMLNFAKGLSGVCKAIKNLNAGGSIIGQIMTIIVGIILGIICVVAIIVSAIITAIAILGFMISNLVSLIQDLPEVISSYVVTLNKFLLLVAKLLAPCKANDSLRRVGPETEYFLDHFIKSDVAIKSDSCFKEINDVFVYLGYFYVYSGAVRTFWVESEYNCFNRIVGDVKETQVYHPVDQQSHEILFESPVVRKPEKFIFDNTFLPYRIYYTRLELAALYPIWYDPKVAETCFNEYSTRVIYSLPMVDVNSVKDYWRVYLAANYKDFSYSPIRVSTFGGNGAIVYFSGTAPMVFKSVETLSAQDSSRAITLGTGELFSMPVQVLDNSFSEFQIGDMKQWFGTITTPAGQTFISGDQGKIFNAANGLKEITVGELKWWFSKYLPLKLKEQFPNYPFIDSPIDGIGYMIAFDNTYYITYFIKKDYSLKEGISAKDVIYNPATNSFIDKKNNVTFSLGDKRYFDDVSITVSYDNKTNKWLSFHDWHPDTVIHMSNHFATTKRNIIYKHNSRCDSYCNFYGVSYPFEVDFIVDSKFDVQVIRNVEYFLEVYKYDANCFDRYLLLDDNFDYAFAYNNEQNTGLLKLVMTPKNNPLARLNYPKYLPGIVEVLYEKVEQKYRFNHFIDLVKDRGEYSGNVNSTIETEPNGYILGVDNSAIDYLKKPTERKKFRHFRNHIHLIRKDGGNDKKYILKLFITKSVSSVR